MKPPPVERGRAVGVVILAAGRSRRMGRPKLLLPWAKTTVLGHLLGQWQTFGAKQVAVVCAVGDQAIQGELDRLGFPAANRIFNPAPDRGMFSSVQCAAQWAGWQQGLTHWAIVLGDQPLVRDRDATPVARIQRRAAADDLPAGSERARAPSRGAAAGGVSRVGGFYRRDTEGVPADPGGGTRRMPRRGSRVGGGHRPAGGLRAGP